MADSADKKKLREVLRVMLSHRGLMLLVAAMFATGVMVLSHRIPAKYTATAQFERRSDAATEGIGGNRSASFGAMKLTLRHDLIGYKAVEQAVDELGWTRNLPRDANGELTVEGKTAKKNMIRSLMRRLRVNWEVSSDQVDLVSVKFTDEDPRRVQQLPNLLVRNYINRVSEEIVNHLSSSRDFLLNQVAGCKRRLAQLNDEKIDFEMQHPGQLLAGPDVMQDRIREYKTDLETLRRQHAIAKQKLARLQGLARILGSWPQQAGQPWPTDAVVPEGSSPGPWSVDGLIDHWSGRACTPADAGRSPAIGQVDDSPVDTSSRWQTVIEGLNDSEHLIGVVGKPDPQVLRLQKKLADLQTRLETALTVNNMTEKHPTVRMLRKSIAGVEQRLQKLPKELPAEATYADSQTASPISGMLAMQLAAAQSEVEVTGNEVQRLENQLASYRQMMSSSSGVRQQYTRILEAVDEQKSQLKRWQARLTDIQMALAAEVANRRTHLNTVQLAQQQLHPLYPPLWMLLGIAVFGGLGAGYGVCYLREILSRTIGSKEEAIRCLGVPVHGVIGQIITSADRARYRLGRIRAAALALVMTVAFGFSTFTVVLRLRYPERYKQLRAVAKRLTDHEIQSPPSELRGNHG